MEWILLATYAEMSVTEKTSPRVMTDIFLASPEIISKKHNCQIVLQPSVQELSDVEQAVRWSN